MFYSFFTFKTPAVENADQGLRNTTPLPGYVPVSSFEVLDVCLHCGGKKALARASDSVVCVLWQRHSEPLQFYTIMNVFLLVNLKWHLFCKNLKACSTVHALKRKGLLLSAYGSVEQIFLKCYGKWSLSLFWLTFLKGSKWCFMCLS